MRTVRSSGRQGGGVCPGECLPRGVPAQGGGVCPSARWDTHSLPCEQNDWYLWKYYLATTTLRTVTIALHNR